MSMAAVRGPLQSPMGQWALVALGAIYVMNPEKFLHLLQRGVQSLLEATPQPLSQQQLPIVIHSMGGGYNQQNRPMFGYYMLMQLTIGAGLCWGSYAVLTTVLPDAAKAMLPVTKGFFNTAITSLGNGILSVRDSLMEQLMGLSDKQGELSVKQDETHAEVLVVKDSVHHVRVDMNRVQQVLDECQSSLTEAEQRQEYIGKGVRLLTRGVHSLLPQDADLAYELDTYNRAGTELLDKPRRTPSVSSSQQQHQPAVSMVSPSPPHVAKHSTPMVTANMVNPENEHPMKKRDLDDIRALLQMVQCGSVQVIS